MAGVVGLAATLTPALSLKGEGEEGRPWLGGGPGGVVLVGLGARGIPLKARRELRGVSGERGVDGAGSPEAASPLGESDEGRLRAWVLGAVWFPSTSSGQALRAAGDSGPAHHERGAGVE